MSARKEIHPEICKIRDLFKESFKFQWVVPIYQRPYVWKSEEDEQIPGMWDDWQAKAEELLNQVEKPLNNGKPSPHYFGAIIYADNPLVSGEIPKRDVVDGQQRLTTFQLALAALRDFGISKNCTNVDSINEYILNIFDNDSMPKDLERYRYKLRPSKLDRPVFQDIVHNDAKGESGLIKAYDSFYEKINDFITKEIKENETAENLIEILKEALLDHFQVVLIRLGDDDDPQQIFASLNGKAEQLTPFDLVRNDIFYRARGNAAEAEKLFEEKWNFAQPFWEKERGRGHARKTHANHFIVDVVVAQTAQEVNQRRIVAKYQSYIKEYNKKGYINSVAEELEVLEKYGKTYRALQSPMKVDADHIGEILRLWDLASISPLAMWIDNIPDIKDDDKKELFLMIESYVVRRHICKLGTRSFTTTVPAILTGMQKAKKRGDSIIVAFKKFLQNADAETTRMPTDNEILDDCENKAIYSNPKSANRLKYILTRIEENSRTKFNEKIPMEDLNIEHIMPQKWATNWDLGIHGKVPDENFRKSVRIKPELENIDIQSLMEKRQGVINTIGNLTLLTPPLNSSVSNDGWQDKKKRFKIDSGLRLNQEIIELDEWNEETIKERSAKLANRINDIWKSYLN